MKKELNKNDLTRWENPRDREIIENAVKEIVATYDSERIRFLIWCVEGSPWEDWTKNYIGQVYRAKFFLENTPRFF